MNRIVKRALWGALIAGGITLAGATAANAAEAPPNGADCGCNVVKSTLTTVTNLLAGPCDQSQTGGQPGEDGTGGTSALPAATQDVTQLVTDTVSAVTDTAGAVTSAVPAPGGSDPGGSNPGEGTVPDSGVVTIPVPGVGTVHAGITPDGLNVGKNLNVAGIKDDWELMAGRSGIATTDRIGTDATNVYVDAAVATTGTTPGHAAITLPVLGNLTGGLPGLPGVPGGVLPGLPGATTPGTGGTGTTPGTGGSGNGATTGGTGAVVTPVSQVVSHVTHGLNAASTTRSAMSRTGNGTLAQTGSDPFLLFAGVLLLAAGAAVKLLEQRR